MVINWIVIAWKVLKIIIIFLYNIGKQTNNRNVNNIMDQYLTQQITILDAGCSNLKIWCAIQQDKPNYSTTTK